MAGAVRGRQVPGLLPALTLIVKTASGKAEDALLRASVMPIVTRSVRVREAGPLLQLLRLPLAAGESRAIPNFLQLEKMADGCDVLLLLQDPLLPRIRQNPTDSKLLYILDDCANKLTEDAGVSGGSFEEKGVALAHRLNAYTTDARAHPEFASYAHLLDSIDHLLRDIQALLDASCTVKLPDTKVAAVVPGAAAAIAVAADAAGPEAEAAAGVEAAEEGVAGVEAAEEGAGPVAEAVAVAALVGGAEFA